MKVRSPLLWPLLVVLIVASVPLFAAAKPQKPAKLGAIGTAQLPGEQCKFGQAYTLGKTDPLNVTLKSAEYTITPIQVGKLVFRPKEGKKLLVIHYTLHNPISKEQRVSGSAIQWTAVDALSKDCKQEYMAAGVEDANHTTLDQVLKPAQKVEAFNIIIVDGTGPVPKLMASRGNPPFPVARWDLHDKVTPLPAPYADPADKTGATVLKEIPGVIGQAYLTGDNEVKVTDLSFVNPPLTNEGFPKGNVYALIGVEIKYLGTMSGGLGGSGAPTSGLEIKDADGASYRRWTGPLATSSNRKIEVRAKPGETYKCRIAVLVASGAQLKTLTFKEFSGYPLVIDISGNTAP